MRNPNAVHLATRTLTIKKLLLVYCQLLTDGLGWLSVLSCTVKAWNYNAKPGKVRKLKTSMANSVADHKDETFIFFLQPKSKKARIYNYANKLIFKV